MIKKDIVDGFPFGYVECLAPKIGIVIISIYAWNLTVVAVKEIKSILDKCKTMTIKSIPNMTFVEKVNGVRIRNVDRYILITISCNKWI